MASSRSDSQRSVDAQSHDLESHKVYVYANLPDCYSVRLLELIGRPDFAPLQCRLVVSGLFVDQSYHALSYAWGETMEKHHNIMLEGKYLLISANLNRALRKVRQPEQDLCLWVDAMCINQDDAA